MVFSAIEMTGEIPFKYVYVHGLVRDSEGRKMSKSLGNGIDPLEIIDQYGADALRFMLMTGVSPGNDMRFNTEKLESSRNFANKLWNASRFVIMNLQDEEGNFKETPDDLEGLPLRDEDKWILSRVNSAVQYVTDSLEKFELSLAGQRAYEVIWNEYCDWYIELVKSRLYGQDEEEKKTVRSVLVYTLKDMLKLLHPFMPFITEEIYSYLPQAEPREGNEEGFLMKENWPEPSEALEYPEEAKRLEVAMEAIKSIRNIRAEVEAAPSKKLRGVILAGGETAETLKACQRYLTTMANLTEVLITEDKELVPEEAMSGIISGAEIFIPLDDLLDYKAEWERLSREEKKLWEEIERIDKKLSNQGFVAKAPEKIIGEEREKLINYKEKLEKIKERLEWVAKKC